MNHTTGILISILELSSPPNPTPHHIITSTAKSLNYWLLFSWLVFSCFCIVRNNTLLRIYSFFIYLTIVFPVPIPANGICILVLITECTQSTSVFCGCVQRSWCQAKQMQQVNEPIDNEKKFDIFLIFCLQRFLCPVWHISSYVHYGSTAQLWVISHASQVH